MKNPTIYTLLTFAERECDNAKLNLMQLNNDYQHALSQLNVLRDYRNGYGDQLQFQITQGLDILHYHNYNTFLANLDQAINQQTAFVSNKLKLVDLAKREWQNYEQKKLSYQKLYERQLKEVKIQTNRIEQKLSDEYSVHLFRVRK